ncbi:3-deoxy-manno-octulosonate cytidylyltransferase [bacterium]|nr:MAG: 3-deoxy-manno-octulosonate cytidylyltransferase [bacterium]
MQALGVIPARYASTRFPGKMLVPILGKPLILWTYQGAAESLLLDHIIIATDDQRIAEVAEHNGADVIMTSPACRNGSERVAEVAKKLHLFDIIVNIQGDEPLITGNIIDKIVEDLIANPQAAISTAYTTINSKYKARNSNSVKVITDIDDFALYFTRAVVPYQRNGIVSPKKHIGIYGYRWEHLVRLSRLKPTPLEQEENLEQLRALEYGMKIHCVEIPEAKNLISVDVPDDIKKVEKILKKKK